MAESSLYEQACRLQYLYAQGVDRRDWDIYRSTMADTMTVDFTSFGYTSVMELPAEGWIRQVRKLMDGLDVSHHAISNCVLDTEGRRLRLRSYVVAQHVLRSTGAPDRRYLVAGTYDNVLERGPGGLLFSSITFGLCWTDGDPAVLTDAAARATAAPRQ